MGDEFTRRLKEYYEGGSYAEMSDVIQKRLREKNMISVGPREAEEWLAEAFPRVWSISDPPGRDLRAVLRHLESHNRLDEIVGARRNTTLDGKPWWWVIARG